MSYQLESKTSTANLYMNSFTEAMAEKNMLIELKNNLEEQLVQQSRLYQIGELQLQDCYDVNRSFEKQLKNEKNKKTFITVTSAIIIGGLTALYVAK